MATILLVEDELPLLQAMSLVLGKAFTIVRASSADAGLAAARGTRVDGVLSDYSMPLKDGVTFARELRAQGFAGPFVIVTAVTDAPEIDQAVKEGVVTKVIAKPWSPAGLVSEMKVLVGLK